MDVVVFRRERVSRLDEGRGQTVGDKARTAVKIMALGPAFARFALAPLGGGPPILVLER